MNWDSNLEACDRYASLIGMETARPVISAMHKVARLTCQTIRMRICILDYLLVLGKYIQAVDASVHPELEKTREVIARLDLERTVL